MRTAYKTWLAVWGATFVLVAAVDLAGNPAPAAKAAGPPPFAPTGIVATVTGHADVTLVDGRAIHIPMLNGLGMDDACSRDAYHRTADAMLRGQPVTLTAPPRRADTSTAVPAGHTQADVIVGGVDFAAVFPERAAEAWLASCRVPEPPPSETAAQSGDSAPVYVDGGDDDDHRDGALTGGYCRKKWWC